MSVVYYVTLCACLPACLLVCATCIFGALSSLWGRPERGGANHNSMEGHGDPRHSRRAEKNGGSLRLGRSSLGDGVGGGPGHPRGNLRLLCESSQPPPWVVSCVVLLSCPSWRCRCRSWQWVVLPQCIFPRTKMSVHPPMYREV